MELRKDPITRSWVLIGAAEREPLPPAQPCPYCAGNEHAARQPILSVPVDSRPGGIRVYPHPRPLYTIEGSAERRADGIFDRMRSLGAHEVIVESQDHERPLFAAPDEEINALLRTWALRVADLKNDLRFKYITVFRNKGELAGQQIRHPHSELTATTFIPRRILYELRASREYYAVKERCVMCDIQQQEERQGLRVVDLTPRYVALCPFASRVPYEMWIVPRVHHATFENDVLRHSDQLELAAMLKRTLARLEQITEDYHLVVHTAPNTRAKIDSTDYWTTIDDDYHWHMEILPITERRSRSYSIKEVYQCALPPEEAAARLRELPAVPPERSQARLEFQQS